MHSTTMRPNSTQAVILQYEVTRLGNATGERGGAYTHAGFVNNVPCRRPLHLVRPLAGR